MIFIHEQAGWPNFYWDMAVLAMPLAALRHQQGRLLGRMQALGFDLRTEANLATLTDDVVKTSAIEGETLDRDEVRSSIARRLGVDAGGLLPASRDVEAIVEIMLDATRNYAQPLTADRLQGWHAALFPTGRSFLQKITVGAWRTDATGPMRVVSGPYGRERVHFQAPAADRLAAEMDGFLAWFNQPEDTATKLDPVLKSGIAHFWFVTLHPFDDGNGRLARAIADLALARADLCPERFYSMSTQIALERNQYYEALERQQRGDLDITPWLRWFLACLERALLRAETALTNILNKARLWDVINQSPVNERQKLVINRLLNDFVGYLSTAKYAKLAKCSTDTALRDILALVDRGILLRNQSGGRSTSYRLATPNEIKLMT